MPYNRTAAVGYARSYWRRVASDGYIGMGGAENYRKVNAGVFDQSAQKEVLRLDTGEAIPIDLIDDCAHFISCCIGRPPGGGAGGISVPSAFPAGPYGQLSADDLFAKLSGTHGSAVGTKLSKPDALLKLGQLTEGDLIFYSDPAKQFEPYKHVAMYMSDTKKSITCHTYSRCDVRDVEPGDPFYKSNWDSVNIQNVKYTLLKLS